MSEHQITVEGGSSVRLPTAGKYCDRDIIVTAQGGGTELPALTSPAAESDVVKGKEFIDASGVKKTGTVEESTDGMVIEEGGALDWEDLGMGVEPVIAATFEKDVLVREGHKVKVPFAYTGFGTATPEDVAKGKTFTCETGVRRVGTNESSGMEEAIVDVQTWAGFGVVMYWMSPEGLINEALPSGRYGVVKNSLLVVIYEGGTYLKTHDVVGGEIVYTNAGDIGYTCTILTFYDDECSVIFEEA